MFMVINLFSWLWSKHLTLQVFYKTLFSKFSIYSSVCHHVWSTESCFFIIVLQKKLTISNHTIHPSVFRQNIVEVMLLIVESNVAWTSTGKMTWLLSSMAYNFMLLTVSFLGKPLFTELAFVRLLSCVHPHMQGQLVRGWKAFPTQVTSMHFDRREFRQLICSQKW